jgi:hypothetical protein
MTAASRNCDSAQKRVRRPYPGWQRWFGCCGRGCRSTECRFQAPRVPRLRDGGPALLALGRRRPSNRGLRRGLVSRPDGTRTSAGDKCRSLSRGSSVTGQFKSFEVPRACSRSAAGSVSRIRSPAFEAERKQPPAMSGWKRPDLAGLTLSGAASGRQGKRRWCRRRHPRRVCRSWSS